MTLFSGRDDSLQSTLLGNVYLVNEGISLYSNKCVAIYRNYRGVILRVGALSESFFPNTVNHDVILEAISIFSCSALFMVFTCPLWVSDLR